MFTLLFVIFMFMVFGKLIMLAVRATWGITKVLFTIVFLPLILIVLFAAGFIYLAWPILLIVGIVSLIAGAK